MEIILTCSFLRVSNHNNVQIKTVFDPGVEATQYVTCCFSHRCLIMCSPQGLGLSRHSWRLKVLCNTSILCKNGFQEEWVFKNVMMEAQTQRQWWRYQRTMLMSHEWCDVRHIILSSSVMIYQTYLYRSCNVTTKRLVVVQQIGFMSFFHSICLHIDASKHFFLLFYCK